MILASGADTVLFALSTTVGVAGALGVAYTIFRSAAEQRLRDVNQDIINNQNLMLAQRDSELAKIRTEAAAATQRAETYRESLTQRAAVEHLSEIVVRESRQRDDEYKATTMLLKDILAQLKHQRGTLG